MPSVKTNQKINKYHNYYKLFDCVENNNIKYNIVSSVRQALLLRIKPHVDLFKGSWTAAK